MFDLVITMFVYIPVSILSGTYLYNGISVHLCLSDKFLFILEISYNFGLLFPIFKGVS